MHILKFTALISALFLTSCLTAQTPSLSDSYQFSSNDNFGLLAYSSDYVSHNSVVVLNKIKEGKDQMGDPIVLGGLITSAYSVGPATNPEFRLAKLLPGTYIWTAIQRGGYNYYNYCRGTLAFEVKSGHVNMIIAKRISPPVPQALSRLKAELKPFPNVTAPIEAANIPYAVRFDFSLDENNGCRGSHVSNVDFKRIPLDQFIQDEGTGDTLN